jgi:hypothetical protein
MTPNRSRRLLLGVAFLLTLTASLAAQGQATGVWTAVAHTAAVDSADRDVYQTNSTGSVAIRSGVSTGNVLLRFSVTGIPAVLRDPYDPEDDGPDQRIQLAARLRDTGAGARVVVRLRRLELESGAINTLATIDSDTAWSTGTPEYFLEFAYLNVPSDFQFDYWHYAYWVEAELSKTTAAANPGLMSVQICNPAGACQHGI